MKNTKTHLQITNLAEVPLNLKFNKTGLKKLVVLPDYCPGVGLDIGTVAVFDRKIHTTNAGYIGLDMGCGMLLARVPSSKEKEIVEIRENLTKNELRYILGGGNHFINFYQVTNSIDSSFNERDLMILVHTGVRNKDNSNQPMSPLSAPLYSQESEARGKATRKEILEKLGLGKLEILLNQAHNTIEAVENKIVYRKGAVKLMPGKLGVIPSHAYGEAVLVLANQKIKELEYSMCHGTGRKISRAIFKKNTQTTNPEYRELSEIKPKIEPYVSMIAKLLPFSREFIELNKIQANILQEVKLLENQKLLKEYVLVTAGASNYQGSTGEKTDEEAKHYLAYCAAIKTLDYVQGRISQIPICEVEQRESQSKLIDLYTQAVKRKVVLEEFSKRSKKY
jgi:hypothetical protein